MPDPNRLRHAFKTFAGIVPDADDPPVCGAVLTSEYNAKGAPDCPECLRIVTRERLASTRYQHLYGENRSATR